MKQCAKCKKKKELGFFNKQKKSPDGLQYYCKECLREAQKHWRDNLSPEKLKRKREKWREWKKEAYKKNPEIFLKRVRDYQKNNPEKAKIWGKRKREKLRMMALDAYGKKCACCGEGVIEFLVIDHINGGGGEHRKKTNNHWLGDLRRRGYPVGFQTLCHNCNAAKYYYKICPHQKQKN